MRSNLTHGSLAIEQARVLLIEELALMRAAIRSLLENFPDVVVVRDSDGGDELMSLVSESAPDLVVTELRLSKVDCISAIFQLKSNPPAPRILILTATTDLALIRRVIQIGVEGFVMKGCSVQEFEYAIRCVMSGKVYYSSNITQLLLTAQDAPDAKLPLTERQLQVLKLLGNGHATKEIAFQLGLSAKTVAAHRARIMERLRVSSLAELVHYCVREGLIAIPNSAGTQERFS